MSARSASTAAVFEKFAHGIQPGCAVAVIESGKLVHATGCDVEGEDTSGFAAAVQAAAGADLAVVVVGDHAGLFGRGTVGEGNDAESLMGAHQSRGSDRQRPNCTIDLDRRPRHPMVTHGMTPGNSLL